MAQYGCRRHSKICRGYQIVYHLKESALPFLDSTLQHPATNGVATVPTPGIVGTGGSFGGIAWLDAGTNDVGDAFTLSAWVNIPPGTSDIDSLWVNKRGGFSQPGFAFFVNTYQVLDQKIDFATGNGTGGNESTTAAGTVPSVRGIWLRSRRIARTTARNSILMAQCGQQFQHPDGLPHGQRLATGYLPG